MFVYLIKLKKNICCFIFVVSFFFISSNCFSNSYLGQGKYLSDNIIKKVERGMVKSRLVELLGNPTFTFMCNVDCLCYYYFYIPSNHDLTIIRRCVLLFFENDILMFHKILY